MQQEFGIAFREFLPDSVHIGIDRDVWNYAIRLNILENWDQRVELARLYGSKLAANEIQADYEICLMSVYYSFFHPIFNDVRTSPQCKETFALDLFVQADYNHLPILDNSIGIVYSYYSWTKDIGKASDKGRLDTPLANEVHRVLIPGGLWITGEYQNPHRIFETYYNKPTPNQKCKPGFTFNRINEKMGVEPTTVLLI